MTFTRHRLGWTALIALIALGTPALGDWQQTDGPEGGFIGALAAHGTTVLAHGAQGASFRSSDLGQSWTHSHNGIALDTTIREAVTIGGGIWLATNGDDVFRSVDDGQTWAPAQTGITATGVGLHVFDGTAYATVVNGGQPELHVWSETYQTWSPITAPHPIRSVVVEGSLIIASNATPYNPIVMRSEDGGNTWTVIDQNLPLLGLDQLVRSGGYTLAVSFSDGLWRSADDGDTWYQVFDPFTFAPNELTRLGDDLFAFEYDTLFRSRDHGDSWQPISAGLINLRSVARADNTLFVLARGVYRSIDDGQTWQPADEGIVATSIPALYEYAGRVAAAENIITGLHFSDDHGQTWTYEPGALPANVRVTAAFEYDANTIFIGTAFNGVYRSDDGGQSWNPANAGLPLYYSGTFQQSIHRPIGFARIGNEVFVATGGASEVIGGTLGQPHYTLSGAGVFRSDNLGQSWQAVRTGFPVHMTNPLYGNPIYASGVEFAQFGDTLLLSTRYYGIYRSADHGASWQAANTGLPAENGDIRLEAAAFVDTGSAILVASETISLDQPFNPIYASQDDGQSWTPWATGLDMDRAVADLVTTPDGLLLAKRHGYLQPGAPVFYESTDDGATWTSLADNLHGVYVNDLHVTATGVLAATNYLGVWQLRNVTPGDLNCDGTINAADIDPFVLALTDPAGYTAAYPTCDAQAADIDGNGAVNAGDIDPFVLLVVGP